MTSPVDYSSQADDLALELSRGALHAATGRGVKRTCSEAYHTAEGSLWVDATFDRSGVAFLWSLKTAGAAPVVKTRPEAVAIIERHLLALCERKAG